MSERKVNAGERLAKALERLERKAWLRRKTWRRLLRLPEDEAPALRGLTGPQSTSARLPDGTLQVRIKEWDDWPDVAPVGLVSEVGGLRHYAVPIWVEYDANSVPRLATVDGAVNYGRQFVTTTATQALVLVGTKDAAGLWVGATPPAWVVVQESEVGVLYSPSLPLSGSALVQLAAILPIRLATLKKPINYAPIR